MIIISRMIPKPMDLKPSFPGLLFYFDFLNSVKDHNELKCINIYWLEHEIESHGLVTTKTLTLARQEDLGLQDFLHPYSQP